VTDRNTQLDRADSCARMANAILSRERQIAANLPEAKPYDDQEDRPALLDVAGQFIELAKAYAAIAAATPGDSRPRTVPLPAPRGASGAA